MGPRPLVAALLFAGLTAAACAAGDGAAPPTDDVDSLWCLYGLAGCSRPAAPLQKRTAQTRGTQEPQAQPSDVPADLTVPTELAQRHATLAADPAPSVAATLTSAASQQEVLAQTDTAGAAQHPAGEEQLLPLACGSSEPHAGSAPEPTAAHMPVSSSLAGIATLEPSGVAAEGGNLTSAAGPVEKEPHKAAAEGMAGGLDKVQAAAQPPTQALLWPLLLGSCIALAALIPLLRRTRRRRLPTVPSRQVARQQTAAPVPRRTVVGGSTDAEAVGAGKLVAPALPAVVCPSSKSAASADLSQLSSPTSPASPAHSRAGPPPLDVDPSVRARDATKQGWVAVEPAAVASSAGSERRKSEFHNPLYTTEGSTAVGQMAAEQLCGAHGSDNLSGSAAEWQAKAAAAAANGAANVQEGEGADFRLLAAALPVPEFHTAPGWTGGETSPPHSDASQLPPISSAFAAGRRSASSDLPSPGSPSKAARKAPRKLTAARSVRPQELAPPPGSEDAIAEGDEEAEEEPSALPLPPPGARQSSVQSVQRLAASTAASPHAQSDVMPHRQAASATASTAGASSSKNAHGLCLLTAREFQEQVKLGRLLGAGAAACVYAGVWRGQPVAVKLAHPSSADPKSFAREVEMMAAVGRHPHIIGVLAACLEQPLAVVQELAQRSLHDQLHTLRLRPQYGLLMQLAEDIASALEHCHAQRPPVVHRDLSGRNVLLAGDGRSARLADFGLAAAKRRTYLSSDKAGALGTAAYMAPEAMQAGQISERCDVFAFGVLLWELLTGRHAWEECDSPLMIIFAVGVERRRLPIPPGCPPPLAKLLKECWRHNAPLRPSFTEVLARLRHMRRTDQFQLVGPLVPGPAAGRKAAVPASAGSRASTSSSKAGSPTGKGLRVLPVSAVAAGSRPVRPPLPTAAA